ncbi:MAG TPA: glycosyltransferase [Flavipsychrobacter sp.]
MNNKLSCAIVLPCYNPQPGWAARVIEQYIAIQARLQVSVEIILVNDGSVPGIPAADIQKLQQHIPSFHYITYDENKGKGYALRTGVADAQSDIIIYTDIDFPYAVDSLVAVYNALDSEGYDAAPGIKDKNYYAKVPVLRRYISQALRFMIAAFFRIPVTDTQCGLKGFKRDVQPVFLSTTIDRYLFDLEFIMLLYRKKYKVKPVPVSLNDNVIFRRMNYKLLLPELVNFLKIVMRK